MRGPNPELMWTGYGNGQRIGPVPPPPIVERWSYCSASTWAHESTLTLSRVPASTFSSLETVTDCPALLDEASRPAVLPDDAGKKAFAGTDMPMTMAAANNMAATDRRREPMVRARDPWRLAGLAETLPDRTGRAFSAALARVGRSRRPVCDRLRDSSAMRSRSLSSRRLVACGNSVMTELLNGGSSDSNESDTERPPAHPGD